MESNRRSFLMSACATGVCACGFSRLAAGATGSGAEPAAETVKDPMPSKWIAALLPQMEKGLDRATSKKLLKSAAMAHFEHLEMDKMLEPHVGKLEPFLEFISKEWGWKIAYDKAKGIIDIDEAKDRCVCPLKHKDVALQSTILCDCSEGFAEKMFSVVVRKPVKAEVVASILRGAKSCRYKVTLQA